MPHEVRTLAQFRAHLDVMRRPDVAAAWDVALDAALARAARDGADLAAATGRPALECEARLDALLPPDARTPARLAVLAGLLDGGQA